VKFEVIFTPEAEQQLETLYFRIAAASSSAIAKRFTDALIDRCLTLDAMPRRGKSRGDLRPGLRTLSFRRRAMIAYMVDARLVTIVGVFYGGQDFETLLKEDE
jgi:toxin ParE1/3/4